MSALREAAQQALDAMRAADERFCMHDIQSHKLVAAIESLREALAQPDDKVPVIRAEMYLALTDAMDYQEERDGSNWSPEEWAAHLYESYQSKQDDKTQPVGELEVFTGCDRLTTFRKLPEGKHLLYAALQPPAEQPEPEWIDDPHDIEQGMMRNPKWKPAEQQAPLTKSYVQVVPDKCDRIVWRNHYYHLPVDSTSKPAEQSAKSNSEATKVIARKLAEIAKNDLEAIPLALHMLGIEPCHTCGYMKMYCRCSKSAEQEPKRPENCGTNYCSCIECPFEQGAELSDEQAELLIDSSDGRWVDGEFRIDGRDLMKLLRAARGGVA